MRILILFIRGGEGNLLIVPAMTHGVDEFGAYYDFDVNRVKNLGPSMNVGGMSSKFIEPRRCYASFTIPDDPLSYYQLIHGRMQNLPRDYKGRVFVYDIEDKGASSASRSELSHLGIPTLYNTNRAIGKNCFQEVFPGLAENAGLPPANYHAHSARRVACTRTSKLAISSKAKLETGGHLTESGFAVYDTTDNRVKAIRSAGIQAGPAAAAFVASESLKPLAPSSTSAATAPSSASAVSSSGGTSSFRSHKRKRSRKRLSDENLIQVPGAGPMQQMLQLMQMQMMQQMMASFQSAPKSKRGKKTEIAESSESEDSCHSDEEGSD